MAKEGDVVKANFIGTAAAFALGLLIAYLGYRVSAYAIKNRPNLYPYTTVFRQILQILYFVAVYFLGDGSSADVLYLLVGAAVGITLPMFYFTSKLVKLNDDLIRERRESEGDG